MYIMRVIYITRRIYDAVNIAQAETQDSREVVTVVTIESVKFKVLKLKYEKNFSKYLKNSNSI